MKNEGLINALRVIGGITIVLGVIACLVLIVQFSQEGMFSKADLTLKELGIAVLLGFYHVAFGILCFAVAEVLTEAGKAAERDPSRQGTQPASASTTTQCPKCSQLYPGDLRGQYCEACGAKL